MANTVNSAGSNLSGYAVTRRDRLAWRLSSLAMKLATPSYRAFLETLWKRGLTDLLVNPPTPEEN